MSELATAARSLQKHQRFPVRARVIRHDGHPGHWQSINVSEGGVFVAGSMLCALGTELDLGMSLPAEPADVEINGRARVVWINKHTGPGSVPHLPVGMGLQFLALSPQAREALTDYLRQRAATRESAADEVETIPVGTIAGSYRILDRIGSGGMGDVYVAEHTTLGRLVALKRLRRQFTGDPLVVARFIDEGRVVNRIRHENIVEITDFFSSGVDKYYVMELLEGETLGALLDRQRSLPVMRVLRIAEQLCDALEAVHAGGVIHCDLKPNNVFVCKRADGSDFVKLLDFGIAKLKSDGDRRADRDETRRVLGTPAYMAPEQCQGELADQRTDIYALGVLMYQALVGRPPFDAAVCADLFEQQVTTTPLPPTILGVELPTALEALTLKCLEKNPAHRLQHAGDVRQALWAIETALALEQAVDAVTTPAHAVAPPQPKRFDSTTPTAWLGVSVARPASPKPEPVAVPEPAAGRGHIWLIIAALVIALFAAGTATLLTFRRYAPSPVDEETLVLEPRR
jgi:serine/threonine protein kinase